MQPNDASALLREYATGGSESAFKEIVRRHVDLVYSTALRRVGRDAQLAAEVTQTVFTDLARKASSLPTGIVLAGWLHRHTCYRAATALRAETRRRTREQKAAEMNAIDQSSNETWPHLAPLLDDALQRLATRDRDAVILRYFEDKTLAETAQTIGISEDAAQKLVSRAVEKLRLHFSRHGVQVASGSIAAAITCNAVRSAPLELVETTSQVALTSSASLLSSTSAILSGVLAVASAATITWLVVTNQSSTARAHTVQAVSHSSPQAGLLSQPVVATNDPLSPAGSPQANALPGSAEVTPVLPEQNLEAATAAQVLQAMAEKYAACRSYFDKGLVRTIFINLDGSRRVDDRPFTTAFVRNDRFRYEFSQQMGKREVHYIVWSDGSAAQTWWDIGSPKLKTMTLGIALAGGTGISGSSASTIPTLLLPDQVNAYKLSALARSVREPDEVVDGVNCIRVQGEFGFNRPQSITVWIEKQTGLVRQMFSAVDFGGFRTETTTSYVATINESIPDELLQFDAPNKN